MKLLTLTTLLITTATLAADPPTTVDLNRQLDTLIQRLTQSAEGDEGKKDVQYFSRRGDALFFRGRFAAAVADYEKMVELQPGLKTSHWRRGIAYFYAEQFKQAAHQFEIYHSFDNVDRENGIWRFLSQVKAYGLKKAREGLLKYEKDDREPFPAVYKLFAGTMTPDEILKQIAAADVSDNEREKRLFYAHLYIGLNHAVEDRLVEAAKHLQKSTANKWGPGAGFGPSYMWHVGRVHLALLKKNKKNDE